tara:strand:- start:23646 stop:24050 length:405 start_codon:yes stop_codon:yes gene_type:complete
LNLGLLWFCVVVIIAISAANGASAAAEASVPAILFASIVTAITLAVRGTKTAKFKIKNVLDARSESEKNNKFLSERFYAQIAQEMASGFLIDGLMARAVAEAYGDKEKASAYYIRYRLAQLMESIAEGNSQRNV